MEIKYNILCSLKAKITLFTFPNAYRCNKLRRKQGDDKHGDLE